MVSSWKRVRNAMGFRILVVFLAWPDGERYMSRACFAHMFCVQITMETYVNDGYIGYKYKWKFNVTDKHNLKISRNGTCDAKRHGNASAGTMVRLKLVFAARMCLQAILDLFCMSSSLNILKKPKRRLVTNEVKTRFEGWSRTRSKRGSNEVPNEVKNYPGQTLTQILELEDFRLQLTVAQPVTLTSIVEIECRAQVRLSKERVEYAHPKTKKTNTELTQMVLK